MRPPGVKVILSDSTVARACLGKPRIRADAFLEGCLEVELAAHGTSRDVADAIADTCQYAELIDAFLADHGRVHIGDEESLATVFCIDHGDVDRPIGNQCSRAPASSKEVATGNSTASFGASQARLAADFRAKPRHQVLIDCAAIRGCYENENGLHRKPDGPLKRAVLIAGATASGKSARALEIAREMNGVIINADAMQVYRELNMLTRGHRH